MNKLLVGLMVVGFFAGSAVHAQDDVVIVEQDAVFDQHATEVSAEVALVSAYVWRGQVLNSGFVVQPQMTVAKHGFSINVWANYDLSENYDRAGNGVSEFDFSLAYSLPFDVNQIAIDFGLVNYNFPGNGETRVPSTTELFISGTFLSFKEYVTPSITAYGDIQEADGVYVLFDIFAPYEVYEYLSVAAGASAGWGNTAYNDHYWGDKDKGRTFDADFNDWNLYLNASYDLTDRLTATANLTYTHLNSGKFEEAADDLYEASEKIWGGVNLAYDF